MTAGREADARPWSDPGHSVIGDVQDIMRKAEAGQMCSHCGHDTLEHAPLCTSTRTPSMRMCGCTAFVVV